jgi:hypothetical protein
LEVLRIIPKSGIGPCFVARWDQKPECLDIDMSGETNCAAKNFKNNSNGYYGHHTNRSTDLDTRIFDIKIGTPAGVLFDGTVSFSNAYEMIKIDTVKLTDTLDAQVISAAGNKDDI